MHKKIKIDELKNPYSILDEILTQLKDTTSNSPLMPSQIYELKQIILISNRDRTIILEKLERDEYITTKEMQPNNLNPSIWTGYYITFEGILLLKNGGYKKQIFRKNLQGNTQISLLIITAIGTLCAGWYGLFEIWKYYYGYPCP